MSKTHTSIDTMSSTAAVMTSTSMATLAPTPAAPESIDSKTGQNTPPSSLPVITAASAVTKKDDKFTAEFHINCKMLNVCDIFLMSNDSKEYRTSDIRELYLYRNEAGKIFYRIYARDGAHTVILDESKLTHEKTKVQLKEKNFDQPSINPIACEDDDICDAVLKLTSQRGHTLLSRRLSSKGDRLELVFYDKKSISAEEKAYSQVYSVLFDNHQQSLQTDEEIEKEALPAQQNAEKLAIGNFNNAAIRINLHGDIIQQPALFCKILSSLLKKNQLQQVIFFMTENNEAKEILKKSGIAPIIKFENLVISHPLPYRQRDNSIIYNVVPRPANPLPGTGCVLS